MLIIGESINVLNSNVYKSIISEDLAPLAVMAVLQVKAGAEALDIHLGPDIKNGETIMQDAVKTIQKYVSVPLLLNGTESMIEAGLSVHKGKAIINGVTTEKSRKHNLLSIAKQYNARIVVMTLSDNGYSREIDDKCHIAMKVIDDALAYGIKKSDIFLDPLLSSYSLNSGAIAEAVECIKHFKECFPDVNTIIGLSNISQGIHKNNISLINSTAMSILVGAGIDAVILNPFDKLLMDTAKTAKLLYTKGIYCNSYLEAKPPLVYKFEPNDFPDEIFNSARTLWEINRG